MCKLFFLFNLIYKNIASKRSEEKNNDFIGTI